MEGTVHDLVPLLHAAGVLRPLKVTLTTPMYPLKEIPEENWVYFSFCAFRQLAHTMHPRSFAAIGTGNGIDAIGAALIFPTLTELYLTDIDPEVLPCSRQNLEDVLAEQNRVPQIYTHSGDLSTGLPDGAIDLCHANLPAIPRDAIRTPWLEYSSAPETPWQSYGLDLQAEYFRGIHSKLTKTGIAIALIGGRMPIAALRELVSAAELEYRELCVGFRKQTEACHALHGYAAIEQRYGVVFDFYRFADAQAVLQVSQISNPTTAVDGDGLKHLLRNYRMSATAALAHHERGEAIGHTVHVIAGVR